MPIERFERDALQDVETQLKVRSAAGPAGFSSVDMEKADIIPNPYNRFGTSLKGFRTGEGYEEGPFKKYYSDMDQALLSAGRDETRDEHVYAVGDRNSDAELYSHEFRHGSGLIDQIKRNGKYFTVEDYEREETMNRMWDGFRADSRDAWDRAVRNWADDHGGMGEGYTYDDAEEHLLKAIEDNLERLSTQEGEAEFSYNNEFTGEHGFNEDLEQYKKLSVTRFEQRQELIDEDDKAFRKKWNKPEK